MANSKSASKSSPSPQTVFVIMPFSETPTRNGTQLKHFYDEWIKKPLEAGRFEHRYRVRRSDETFNINEQIIKDLYAADIVVADLSGIVPNPNVMYELGMRLAFSNRPVILIREQNAANRSVFDVAGFYAEPYDPLNASNVSAYLRTKIQRFETGQEVYRSPVLAVLGHEFPLLMQLSRRRAAELLDVLDDSLVGVQRLFNGAATDFVHKMSELRLGKLTSSFMEEIATHHDVVKKLPWKRFSFRPGSQPAIDYYIASPYLHGLVADDIEQRFTEMVIEYHSHFFAGDTLWQEGHLNKVTLFAGETKLLSLLCRILMRMLRSTDESTTKKTTADFEAVYKQSYWRIEESDTEKADQSTADTLSAKKRSQPTAHRSTKKRRG